MSKVVKVALIAAAVAVVSQAIPDIKRYMEIRAM